MISAEKLTLLPEMQLKLLGCVYYGDPFHAAREFSKDNEIGKLWTRFFNLYKKYDTLFSRITPDWHIGYEIHIESDEYLTTRQYCVFVGMETRAFEEQPPELFGKILPKTKYVIITTKGMLHQPVEQLLREWLPDSEFVQAFRYIIERYDSRRFRSLEDKNSEIDWLVPVRRRGVG